MTQHALRHNNKPQTNFRRSLLSSAVSCALALTVPPCAMATTYTVTNNNDSGTGSLRAAVSSANSDVSPPATVAFQTGLASPITLTTGAIAITQAMNIEGPGSNKLTVSGNNSSRIFSIKSGSAAGLAVLIDGLTLTGGNAGNGNGGAIYSQGATLTVAHSTLTGNTTGSATASNQGGAIFASSYNSPGRLYVQFSTLSGNTASARGGAIYATGTSQASIYSTSLNNNTAGGDGGAAYLSSNAISLSYSTISGNRAGQKGGGARLQNATGTFNVSHCAFTGNGAVSGGALYFFHGAPTVSNTTISGNTGSGSGGGIYASSTNLTVTSSTISGNTSVGTGTNTGGGVYSLNAALKIEQSLISGNTAHSGGGLTVNNPVYGTASGVAIQYSTFSQNTANSGRGGGIDIAYDTSYAATLTNVTIVGNTSSNTNQYGGGIFSNAGKGGSGTLTIQSSTIVNNSAGGGGGIYDNPGAAAIVVHNTIVANNSASTTAPDLDGAFLANYNLIRDTTGATLNAGSANNLTGADPQLGSLGYYGGPTPTKLPLSTSPVTDAGDPAATALTTDQRGYARVVNSRIDMGADERQTSEDTIFLDGFEGY